MNSKTKKNKFEDLKTVQDNMIDSLKRLTAYNKSDSPAFSQTFSLLFQIQDLIESVNTDRYFEALERVKSHTVTILTCKSLTSEDWDGAPLELVEECRQNWVNYTSLLASNKR